MAAGAIAEKYLRLAHGVEIVAFVSSIGHEFLFAPSAAHPSAATDPAFVRLLESIDRRTVDEFAPVRCPDAAAAARMEQLVRQFRDGGDSIGGTVTCVVRNCPAGLGEPCFDKLEAQLAHAMLSIPATKGFEIGSGFGGCQMAGSVHNDAFVRAVDRDTVPQQAQHPQEQRAVRLTTRTNNSGGVQGGISNGAPIFFSVGFKPPATISQAQDTASYAGEAGVLEAKGRHDPVLVPRAVPIVEAMAALVVMDAVLAQGARRWARSALADAGDDAGGSAAGVA